MNQQAISTRVVQSHGNPPDGNILFMFNGADLLVLFALLVTFVKPSTIDSRQIPTEILIIIVDAILEKRVNSEGASNSKEDTPGEYEYIDAMIDEERLIIDIDFRSEFQIARSTKRYKAVLQTLPQIFVGKLDHLQKIINIVSNAAKQSLKKIRMPLPSWRRADYVKAKCSHLALTSPTPQSKQIRVLLMISLGAAPEVEKSKEAMKQWDIIGMVYNKGSIMQKPKISEYLSDSMRHVPTNHDIEENEESKVETLEDLF
ncbi:hypothetical protein Tco_0966239 [Tanacetum coccineum]